MYELPIAPPTIPADAWIGNGQPEAGDLGPGEKGVDVWFSDEEGGHFLASPVCSVVTSDRGA